MDMIDGFGKSAIVVAARVLFHKLFETVFVQLLVFHVKVFVLFHVSFVLERELATRSIAMEMGGFLRAEWAIVCCTVFAPSEPMKD